MVKSLPDSAGNVGSVPGLGRSPAEGHACPPQHPCLGNPRDRGAWRAPVGRDSTHTQWKGPGFGGWQTRVCVPPPSVAWSAWSLTVPSSGGGDGETGCGGAGEGRAENRQPRAMLVSFPFFIQSLTGGQKRPRESSRYWESGERGECHASLPFPWTPESGDLPGQQRGLLSPLTQWLGQKAQRCLALCRGCLSQRGQEPGGLAGACCRLLSLVQGLPPWTQRDAWGIRTIEGLVPAFSFSCHPACFILWGGIKPSER